MTPSEHDQRVAARARGRIAEAGVRQADVAAALRITQPALSRKLNGHRVFTVSELYALADCLGLPVADLVPVPLPATAAC